jgi:hypothetical protein
MMKERQKSYKSLKLFSCVLGHNKMGPKTVL